MGVPVLGSLFSGIKRGYDFVTGLGDESDSAKQQRDDLNNQGSLSSLFANQGEQGFGQLGAEAQQQRDYLRRVASGQESLARQQLAQQVAQQQAQQRALAASAPASSQAMAARNAAMNINRARTAMGGQAAMAGVAERANANQALGQMLLQQRGQDLQAALGGRQTAVGAYGGVKPEGSFIDKYGGAIMGGLGLKFGQGGGK